MDNFDEINERQSEIDDRNRRAQISQLELIDRPFEWINILTESVVTLIMSFSIFYFILEINEVTQHKDFQPYKHANNIVEIVYLLFTIFAIFLHLIWFRVNQFVRIEFDNYPMLFVMVILALIDVSYYVMNFISIATECNDLTRILSTVVELLFIFVILPFVVICVCSNVCSEVPILEVKTKVTLLLTMAGCLVIVIRKMSLKIEKDIYNLTTLSNDSCVNTNLRFVHQQAETAERVLELVDIVYILIAFVFMIDPLRKVSKLKSEKDDVNFVSLQKKTDMSRLESLSLVRFRWPTIVLSILLVCVLLSASYIITPIMDSKNATESFKSDSLTVYLICTTVSYVVGTIYGVIYYFKDILSWPKRENIYLRNDEHFNLFSSAFQIIYASGMIISLLYFYPNHNMNSLLIAEIFDFLLLAVQVLVQAGCINSAIRRKVKIHDVQNWKSKFFAPLLLASMNFGFVIISIVYSRNAIFTSFLEDFSANRFIYYVIKDIALPITILNRLHGMAFFINLSIQQWRP